MNKRIKEFAEESGAQFVDACQDYFGNKYPAAILTDEVDLEKFANLIILDCLLTIQYKIMRNGRTPENERSRLHVTNITDRFDIKIPIEYPKGFVEKYYGWDKEK